MRKKKILIFYQYFATPKGSWGTRIYEFAKIWVEEGYDVEVITSIYSKSDLKASGIFKNIDVEGINVKVLNIKIDNKHSFLRRVYSFIAYSILSSVLAVFKRTDVTIASSGPISVALPGLISKITSGSKLVFEVRDLWPQGAIELGILKNPIIIRFARFVEKTMYRYSDLIVGLSPGMRDYIKLNHPNVISITNSANINLFQGNRNQIPKSFQGSKFAIYTGNIGEVNNSLWLLDAGIELKRLGRDDVKILLVGDGQLKTHILDRIERDQINSLVHLPLMPKQELVPFIQNAMVSLVPLKGTPILDTSSPNKFFESLAAGTPIVQNTNGWMKDYIEINEVGFTLDPNSPQDLANLLIDIADKNLNIEGMRYNALNCAKKDFDQSVLALKYLDAIEFICL
jgi:glycosyltransferase involved in cell wall biosynthesis